MRKSKQTPAFRRSCKPLLIQTQFLQLRKKQVFDREEWRQLQVQKLPRNCYIDVDGKIYSPAGPDHDYAATDADVAHLLQFVGPDHEKRDEITAVLKRFGYKKQWREWRKCPSGCDDEWQNANAETGLDLNYIVKLVNSANRAQGTAVPNFERIFLDEPALSEANMRRVTNLDEQFLSADMLDTKHRVTAVKSCTGTGKTQATIDYAKKKGMLVLSVCCLKTQVQEHRKTFGAKLRTRTVDYKDRCDLTPGRSRRQLRHDGG